MLRAGLLVSLAAALLVPAATAGRRVEGGVYGTVRVGPVTPVCVEGRPCSRPAAGVTLQALRAGRVVASTVTRSDGGFRLALAPGRYTLRIAHAFKTAATPVVVRSGWSRRTLVLDTGIRGPVTGGGPVTRGGAGRA